MSRIITFSAITLFIANTAATAQTETTPAKQDHPFTQYVNNVTQSLITSLVGDKNYRATKRLIKAIEQNDLNSVIEAVAQGAQVNENQNLTPLQTAAYHGSLAILQFLIRAGANVNITNSRGETALMIAAANGHAEVVSELINAGAEVDKQDSYGRTALMHLTRRAHTSYNSHLKYIKALRALALHASINRQDKSGHTALMYTCFSQHYDRIYFEIALELIRWGANVLLKDNEQKDALELAAHPFGSQFKNEALIALLVNEYIKQSAH